MNVPVTNKNLSEIKIGEKLFGVSDKDVIIELELKEDRTLSTLSTIFIEDKLKLYEKEGNYFTILNDVELQIFLKYKRKPQNAEPLGGRSRKRRSKHRNRRAISFRRRNRRKAKSEAISRKAKGV